MQQQIKAQVEERPFQPFSIELNDGRSIPVPNYEHIMVGQFAATIEDDAGIIRILPYRNISGLTINPMA
jgi:hypothetical protein